ncbi:hypothetical protein [Gilvimarinus agarilyticus]|uniref:hypothetical protein n=1 Tax=Gilvimarinus agarilyticus TaxID=679259 RepID=UPI0012FA8649|nr:hypothetical protein [Gilvimarinus agarilyticus]
MIFTNLAVKPEGAYWLPCWLSLVKTWLFVISALLLSACGGGGGGDSGGAIISSSSVATSVSSSSTSSFSSSSSNSVYISGSVSYDFVPVRKAQGLDYNATAHKPVRAAKVNLIDEAGAVVATAQTDQQGHYTLTSPRDRQVKVQVEAYSYADAAQRWEIRVEDNTANNALYVLEGELLNSGQSDSMRDLHAGSGWDGNQYSQPRAAAPFAILDTAYRSMQSLLEVDPNLTLPTSIFRWSENNTVAIGDYGDGDIGTSFYNGAAVYVLGQAGVDSDEYDAHVIAHEWGHFVEVQLGGRSDSIGGDHSITDRLDMRVAYSEGFANGFSAYVLADPEYRDTFGLRQARSSGFDVSLKNPAVRGWYSESSIQSIFYHLAEFGAFDAIYSVFSDLRYETIPAFTSIFSFAELLAELDPQAFAELDRLMNQQLIVSRDAYGEAETNNGSTQGALPVYVNLVAGGRAVVCSSQQNGQQNKLGVHAFLATTIFASGQYRLLVENNGERAAETDPDIVVNGAGERWVGLSAQVDAESLDLNMQAGERYAIAVTDYQNHADALTPNYQPACFNVSLTSI